MESFDGLLGLAKSSKKNPRRARYHAGMDMMLYLQRDEQYVAERVDYFLTLLWGGPDGRELIGVKLKGFRNLFLTLQKSMPQIGEDAFLPLVSFLENYYSSRAAELLADPARKEKYKDAIALVQWCLVERDEFKAIAA